METALKQQLIATLLNPRYGYIGDDTVIYYNGSFATIGNVVSEALNALNGGSRSMQEYYKTLLDYVNNNVHIVHLMQRVKPF